MRVGAGKGDASNGFLDIIDAMGLEGMLSGSGSALRGSGTMLGRSSGSSWLVSKRPTFGDRSDLKDSTGEGAATTTGGRGGEGASSSETFAEAAVTPPPGSGLKAGIDKVGLGSDSFPGPCGSCLSGSTPKPSAGKSSATTASDTDDAGGPIEGRPTEVVGRDSIGQSRSTLAASPLPHSTSLDGESAGSKPLSAAPAPR
jgi:hypothetical protein